VLIAGPTASGKSALALDLAERIGGTLVNADSMQIYRGLAVLTARPSAAEEARAPHRLYGVAAPGEDWSVGRWLGEATAAIRAVEAAGRVPIVVGGTGLYFHALTEGLAELPAIPSDVRDPIRAEPDLAVLRRRLTERDPAMAARLGPNDRARIARALEVVEATGRSLADWQAAPAALPVAGPGWRRLVVAPERAALHARIERRFDAMVGQGALDEVGALMALGLTAGTGIMKAIGLRPLAAHLAGDLALAEAIARAKAETRQYAKRQETWLRHRMADWERVPPP
jgi:tRNA dimethylallyltransferase